MPTAKNRTIAEQAKVNLARIKEAVAKGSMGPFKPTPQQAKQPEPKPSPATADARQVKSRQQQEKALGYSRKGGYTGD